MIPRANLRQFQGQRSGFDVGRQTRWLAVALVSVLVIGTVGYLILGLSFLEAAYTTVFVVTTVGFREPYELTAAGKIFTIFLMLGGIGTVLYSLTLLVAIFIDGHVSTLLEGRRMQRTIDGLQDLSLIHI